MEKICGIYKITNLQNQHCYIGQSRNISNRWKHHQMTAHNPNDNCYEYPLYRAFRKYGMEQFQFEIIEECSIDMLNKREQYWIEYYKPEYNQTIGVNYNIIPQKLTYEQVQEIQQILINDVNGKISHKELGERFGVSGKDTIRDINVGRTWYNPSLNYPLHISHLDTRYLKEYHCSMCGCLIITNSTYCKNCSHIAERQVERPSREELKSMIRELPFTTIGKKFNVCDNTIRKWCKYYNLPNKKKDIKIYNDQEWLNV